MKRNVALVLNAGRPKEMGERFQALFTEVDEKVAITEINLGVGFARNIPSDADEILFSGGTREKLSSNRELKAEIFGVVRGIAIPVMGVCFGSQVIARAHGARIIKLSQKRFGDTEITVNGSDPYFAELEGSRTVYESHLWALPEEDFPPEMGIHAQSDDGVEIFAHRQLPQAGVQFHPERNIGINSGLVLFDALRKRVIDKAQKP